MRTAADMAQPAVVPLQPSASHQEKPVLACEGLRKVYRMGEVDVRALDGVNFTLAPGDAGDGESGSRI